MPPMISGSLWMTLVAFTVLSSNRKSAPRMIAPVRRSDQRF
ncbi:MAG: hypothetical protein AVDCRST_MAG89-2380 [uncultured Gemmatimonadetes bacterium]|uniref:Uncharacterized protein n=1 Tax=uncultured Gemmatimonadota bacterium TaxID=203437 RepID=A0A6J4LLI0_9BACT|nr:MAG: hypothetical protein AVDCRST_MAG89-2380 [uncultured Gemmatimonadota bacterium]